MAINSIKMIIPCQCLLGEGPYYSASLKCLFWVDILDKLLYRFDCQQQTVCRYPMEQAICWIMETTEQRLIAGFERGIYYLDNNTFQPSELYPLATLAVNNRLNDAKTDRNGHVFFGTMDKHEQHNTGALYRFGQQQTPTIVDSNYVISNGPAISKNGRILYSTESSTRTIYQFDLNEQGELSNKRVFVKFDETMGFPDGMTVDNDNHLWVASWNGHGLYRFCENGSIVHFYRLPAPRITSLTFFGDDLTTIAVTSARTGLEPEILKQYPYSGAVFILQADIQGIAETPAQLCS
ncbi:SMP-30/gluconolactonase/LRE family protein [Pseudoalteromonas rhizosphaerae]|uniref:SMP-30/gluconolactonase/LRE family protein n=1 Tax=Pseudoalteromonas rhizosphaerae TaxID=2518973 RepID=UPI00384BCCE4